MFEIGLGAAFIIVAAAVLLIVFAVSTHFVFRPLLVELVERGRLGRGAAPGSALEARVQALEAELQEMGQEVGRLREARDFDRALEGGREPR